MRQAGRNVTKDNVHYNLTTQDLNEPVFSEATL